MAARSQSKKWSELDERNLQYLGNWEKLPMKPTSSGLFMRARFAVRFIHR